MTQAPHQHIRPIEFFGDITCPWTHLGWRRLCAALRGRGLEGVYPIWRPFQLNPDLPLEGMPRNAFLLRKFGTAERVREVLRAVDLAMRHDGLHVALYSIQTMPNTALAHLLLMDAQTRTPSLAQQLMEQFFITFFVRGFNIGQVDVLTKIAANVGLVFDKDDLQSRYAYGLVHAAQMAEQLGIRAVPYARFDGRYSLAGAHESNAFAPLIDACVVAAQPDLDAAG
jgi:predicted DsbA family dithiol-disulfide isomerase